MEKITKITGRVAAMACGIAVLFGAGSAHAASSHSNVSSMGRHFVANAARTNMEEITVSQAVLKSPPNPQDRAFAQRMIKDHTKNEKMLEAVAGKLNVPLPTTISDKQKATNEKLMHLKGDSFQVTYRNQMIKGHEAAITDFNQEIAQAHNAQLRNYAVKTLPVLHTHLSLAKALPRTAPKDARLTR